jgi:esterase/lipase superfamily enzyme
MQKQIRFFATNRDRHNLGRNVKREQRIQLQKGGYHWVDMKKYMAHYLATTEPSSMPPEVIITNSEEDVFKVFLNKNNVKHIIIGIHGYNVSFHGALTSFSVLADTLSIALKLEKSDLTLITDPIVYEEFKAASDGVNVKGIKIKYDPILEDPNKKLIAFVGFSWPSNSKVVDYLPDRVDAVGAAPALANLIGYIRTQNPNAKIHIIAHSMGNYLTCHMLGDLVTKTIKPIYYNDAIERQLERQDLGGENAFFIDRYLMLAPDVERREVTQCDVDSLSGTVSEYSGPFFAGLRHLVQETHVFYSRYDNALKASVIEKDVVHESLQRGIEVFTSPDLQKRWESSLGLNPLPALAPINMESHNATTLTNRTIDHGDYFDALDIAKKIAEVIMKD